MFGVDLDRPVAVITLFESEHKLQGTVSFNGSKLTLSLTEPAFPLGKYHIFLSESALKCWLSFSPVPSIPGVRLVVIPVVLPVTLLFALTKLTLRKNLTKTIRTTECLSLCGSHWFCSSKTWLFSPSTILITLFSCSLFPAKLHINSLTRYAGHELG